MEFLLGDVSAYVGNPVRTARDIEKEAELDIEDEAADKEKDEADNNRPDQEDEWDDREEPEDSGRQNRGRKGRAGASSNVRNAAIASPASISSSAAAVFRPLPPRLSPTDLAVEYCLTNLQTNQGKRVKAVNSKVNHLAAVIRTLTHVKRAIFNAQIEK